MKRPVKLVTIIIVLILSITYLPAQDKIKEIPKKFLIPEETVSIATSADITSPKTNWIVLSDRTNNPVYSGSGIEAPSQHLPFLEKLAVFEVNGKRLKVTKIENTSSGRLIPQRQTFWIDQDNVLMWNRCLVSMPYKFDKKAMVLNVWKEDNVEALKQKPKYYDAPSTSAKMVDEAGTYQIRYVYKEIPGFILVGTDPGFSAASRADTSIIGWVPTTHITPWDHRVAWELNWYPQAASEREWIDHSKQISRGVLIFDSLESTNLYQDTRTFTSLDQFEKIAYAETPIYDKRQPGKFDRFPVLNDDKALAEGFDFFDPQRVGVIGKISTAKGDLDKQKMIKLGKEVLEIEENQRKINVIFVIDATFSMDVYSGSVAIALDSAMSYINREQQDKKSRNTFKFGAVLYRDEAETNPVHVHSNQFTQDIGELGAWITKYMNPAYYGKDKDLPEAVYYGIDQALTAYLPNREQTNYIIVIGDAGDHGNKNKTKTFVSESKLINKLADRHINLLSYQVHRPDQKAVDSTYREFEAQMKRLMLGTATKIKELDASNAKETKTIIAQPIEIITEKSSNQFRLSSNSPIFGIIKTSNSNDSIRVDTLRTGITQNIKLIHRYINDKISEIARLLEGDSITSGSETAASIIYDLLARGTSIEDLQKILSDKRQIYKEGFTVFQKNDKEYPNFQNVIFIEQTDLNSLKETVRNLVLSSDNSQPPNIIRNRVATTVINIFETYVGDLSEEEVNTKPFGDLLFLITGLPTKDEYRSWTINDIKDPAEISDVDLMGFSADIRQTLIYLTKIIELGSNYTSIIKDIGDSDTYYWIPGDVFPHNKKSDEVGAGI